MEHLPVFESHLTVAATELTAFRAACAGLGVKCVAIDLPAGETPLQPMTSSHHRGLLPAVEGEVRALARELARRGYPVRRTKIEAVGPHHVLPERDDEAEPGRYFEHHARLVLPLDHDLAALAAACQRLGAHLSRNALRTDPDGLATRFVTRRGFGVGRATAEAAFQGVLAMLRGRGLTPRRVQREYAVLDTNLGLDRGWIDS